MCYMQFGVKFTLSIQIYMTILVAAVAMIQNDHQKLLEMIMILNHLLLVSVVSVTYRQ